MENRQNSFQRSGQYYSNTKSDYSNQNFNGNKKNYNEQYYKNPGKQRENRQPTWFNRYNRSSYDQENIVYEDEIFINEHLEQMKKKTNFDFEKMENVDLKIFHNGIEITDQLDTYKTFAEVNLHKKLTENIKRLGFESMTPIQSISIPQATKGKDVIGCAQTGSGKTIAFLAPIINKMLNEGPPTSDYNLPRNVSAPLALVLTPTRELADQIWIEARKLLYKTGICVTKVYGGVPYDGQIREIKRGTDILVATPGRLIDFLKRNSIVLDSIKFLVFDEADRMLDMGFEDQINEILISSDIRPKEERTNMMFSATFNSQVREISMAFMNDYFFISRSLEDENKANENIEQQLIYLTDDDKIMKLHEVLQSVRGSVIIFRETKRGVDDLSYFLNQRNYNTISIHGDKTQDMRKQAIKYFSNGDVPILIATDVAARGLDFPNVPFVFNYDMPTNIDDYIHRIGRTGRCGNKGTAFAFITDQCRIVKDLIQLLEKVSQEIPDWLKQLSYRSDQRPSYNKKKNSRGGFGNSSFKKPFKSYSGSTGYQNQGRFNNSNRGGNDLERPQFFNSQK